MSDQEKNTGRTDDMDFSALDEELARMAEETPEVPADFHENWARMIREGLRDAGYEVFGGVNAPYLWVRTPEGMDSWSFFDVLLKEKGLVVTPGAGFGPCGEGYVRLTAFGTHENTRKAMERMQA